MKAQQLFPGVMFQLYRNGKKLPIGRRGRIGRLGVGEVTIVCQIPPDCPEIIPFVVNREKRVVRLSEGGELEVRESYRGFCRSVNIKRPNWKPLVPDNDLRLIAFDPSGTIAIKQVALVRYGDAFFCTHQVTYEAQAYKEETAGGFVNVVCPCPAINNWPDVLDMVVDHFNLHSNRLPPIASYEPPTPIRLNGIEYGQGIVEWYNLAEGRGLLHTRDQHGKEEVARVRVDEIKSASEGHLPVLFPQQKVTYHHLRDAAKGTHGTSFKWDAIEVCAAG